MFQKRPTKRLMYNNTDLCVPRELCSNKRYLFIWLKRPIHTTQETNVCDKRDLCVQQKRPMRTTKETYKTDTAVTWDLQSDKRYLWINPKRPMHTTKQTTIYNKQDLKRVQRLTHWYNQVRIRLERFGVSDHRQKRPMYIRKETYAYHQRWQCKKKQKKHIKETNVWRIGTIRCDAPRALRHIRCRLQCRPRHRRRTSFTARVSLSAKEPYISAKETCISTKSLFLQKSPVYLQQAYTCKRAPHSHRPNKSLACWVSLSAKETYISAKKKLYICNMALYIAKEPYIAIAPCKSSESGLFFRKRSLHICKRALCVCKRALYIAKEPYIAISAVQVSRARSLHPQKGPTYLQKKKTSAKGPYISQKSPT